MYENINFTDLNNDEAKLVLSWRNNPDIKKWMHTKGDISLESHLNFIKSLKGNKEKDYFLVKKKSEYIGVIDLNGSFLGIYANPNKKGVGDILLKAIIKFAFETKKIPCLNAEVYKNNYSALRLYTRFGFESRLDDGTILTMGLDNENR